MAATIYRNSSQSNRFTATGGRQRRSSMLPKLILLIIALLAVGAAGVTGWRYVTSRSYASQKTPYGTVTSNPNVPGGSHTGQTPAESDGAKASSGNNSTSLDPSLTPDAPTGQFVSYHSPRLSGGEQYMTETSSCITTPGAYCQIRFQQGGVTRSLPAKIAGSDGAVLWSNWKLTDIGLTAGTWEITALATNGSHSSSTKDPTNLTVSP